MLVRGAAGSIGIMAVQLAAAGGASTVAVTTSSSERGELLRSLGATIVFDRDGNALGSDMLDTSTLDTGTRDTDPRDTDADSSGSRDAATRTSIAHDFDVVIDVVGGTALPTFIERLAPNGRFVSVGVVGGYPPTDFGMTLMRSFQKSRSFATFSLNTVPITRRNVKRAALFEAASRGELRSVVHDVLPLSQAADAHRRMDSGEVFGRIVLTP
ncbi:zinc-binding dehydrogenase [Subtercola lobariae]|uniref:Alcohol dehydrogenase-like C-terminal domain-containing protein n=1 Tax=Subtercola lobariae TaxID=1588641 RepID=A0A917F0H4_9MICO|nr:zinc-binding dehydrogenase [Subtercola lobariae]GGF40085.1 hypothetical protein GCM10011399_36180 [Subtercola lobariae]